MASSGFSGSMEEDFPTESQLWKKVHQTRNQNTAHVQKRVTATKLKKTYTRGTNISLKGGQRWIASVQPFPPLQQTQGLIEGAAKNLPNNPRQENGGTPLVFSRETPWARACLPITPCVLCYTWFIICTFNKDK